jgi:hypothetical protein
MGGRNGGDPGDADRVLRDALALFERRDPGASLDPDTAALREAADQRVLEIAAKALAPGDTDADTDAAGDDPFGDMAERVTSIMRDHPDALLYTARAAIEGDASGLGLFDAFVAIAKQRLEELAADGRLDPDLDVEWAALHVVIFNLSTPLFERAAENHLPEPLRSPAGVERWHRADTELFRRGFLRERVPRV